MNRYASAHGGLAIYIHKNWNFKEKNRYNRVASLGGNVC